jgi:predicted Zn-ribbon and HTH transcriptional regulator
MMSVSGSNITAQEWPHDDTKLWPKAVVRKIGPKNSRHTITSLLMMSGADPAAVQRILGHSNPEITTKVYGHLSPHFLRAEAERLSLNPAALKNSERRSHVKKNSAGAERCCICYRVTKRPFLS